MFSNTLEEARTWMKGAACQAVDPDLFYPEHGQSARRAKEVCAGCPVQETCLEYALTHGEIWGVWGGVTERDRKRMRRGRRLAVTAA